MLSQKTKINTNISLEKLKINLQRRCNAHILALTICSIGKQNSVFCLHTEPSTPKRVLIKKPLNCKFIKRTYWRANSFTFKHNLGILSCCYIQLWLFVYQEPTIYSCYLSIRWYCTFNVLKFFFWARNVPMAFTY